MSRLDNPVRIAFFGGLVGLDRVEDPRQPRGSRVWVESLTDLAGMKMRVIQMRGECAQGLIAVPITASTPSCISFREHSVSSNLRHRGQ